MAKMHMKKCSSFLAIKEMHIKTTLRFYLTAVRIVNNKNTITNKCWQRCWKECKLVQPLWKTIWMLLKKLNIDLSYDPANHPMACKLGHYKGTSTPMFIAALFTTAKPWKQPRCPTTDE
jgi:hypothetical protein